MINEKGMTSKNYLICKVCKKPIWNGQTTDINKTIHSGCIKQ